MGRWGDYMGFNPQLAVLHAVIDKLREHLAQEMNVTTFEREWLRPHSYFIAIKPMGAWGFKEQAWEHMPGIRAVKLVRDNVDNIVAEILRQLREAHPEWVKGA